MRTKDLANPHKSLKTQNLQKPLVCEQPPDVLPDDLPRLRRHVERTPAAYLRITIKQLKKNKKPSRKKKAPANQGIKHNFKEETERVKEEQNKQPHLYTALTWGEYPN